MQRGSSEIPTASPSHCTLSKFAKNRYTHKSFVSFKIKAVHASWVRDETWPANMRAPEPDDELPYDLAPEPVALERIEKVNGSSPHAKPPVT